MDKTRKNGFSKLIFSCSSHDNINIFNIDGVKCDIKMKVFKNLI